MKQRRFLLILISALSLIGFFLAMHTFESVYFDSSYHPLYPDSFYHARRILDVYNGVGLYQFDQRIHAPDGAYLTWPWLYDWLIGQFVTVAMWVNSAWDPMEILAYIPSVWLFVNTALFILFFNAIGLSRRWIALAGLMFALSPLTRHLHAFGRIDAHYMELTFVLLNLYFGYITLCTDSGTDKNTGDGEKSGAIDLWGIKKRVFQYQTVLLALFLGVAPAIHNSLFVLQVPLVLTVVFIWVKGNDINLNVKLFSIVFLFSVLITLSFAQPFQNFLFSFYYYSWFHLYVAVATISVIFFVSFIRFSYLNFLLLIVLGLLVSWPLINQILHGTQFLSAEMPFLDAIQETKSPFRFLGFNALTIEHLSRTLSSYSLLILFLPVMAVFWLLMLFRKISSAQIFLSVSALFGLLLLSLQYRLHYFGFALMLLSSVMLGRELLLRYQFEKKGEWLLVGFFVVCLISMLFGLTRGEYKGGSLVYANTYSIYPAFKRACDKKSGVVLAHKDDGHFIRYHTECSVLANSFIMAPDDIESIKETQRLYALSAEQLWQNEPWIDYVYLRLDMTTEKALMDGISKGLTADLLFNHNKHLTKYELIDEIVVDQVPVARLFKIIR